MDLELPARTLVRISGTNGTGKSTLLRLIAGIDAPSEGRIEGRPRTAYVPERFPGVLPFTAVGYLRHIGRIHGLDRRTARARADEWLTRFGAAEHSGTPLAELSKGTSQKVAVAQALLAEPELLVLDEAWTGLDAAARAELDRAVAERVASGATAVYVDHDPLRLADAADVVHSVSAGTLIPAPDSIPGAPPPAATAAGPQVQVIATGPPGAPPPDGLPGTPEHEVRPDGDIVFTVTAPYSDSLLRALLSARPPWHVRQVEHREATKVSQG